MSGPLFFLLLLLQPSPAAPARPAARIWLEEAHRQARELEPQTRVHALQRLSVLAARAAPELAGVYFREAFLAAADIGDATRRGKIQYQLVRDLAGSSPAAALELALEIRTSSTDSVDWRLAAATMALDAWSKQDPGQAFQGMERIYAAGISDLGPATLLLRRVRTVRPDLATQVFQRSLVAYQAAPHREVGLLVELIFQSQMMLSVNRDLALKTLRSLMGDIDELAKSQGEEAPAAVGLRTLALDAIRQVDPEEAEKLSRKDPEAAKLLEQMPAGFTAPGNEATADVAPGIEPLPPQDLLPPPVNADEERQVNLAILGLARREEQWTPERLAELASRVSSPFSRARLHIALALLYLTEHDKKAEPALRDALASLGELYDSEPQNLSASQRRSTYLYNQLIGPLALENADRALALAKSLPNPETRFEVLFQTAGRLSSREQKPR